MNFDDSDLKFYGFPPTDFTRAQIGEVLSGLLDQAPYGAHLNAMISRHAHQYRGVISIHSSVGRFFAVAAGQKINDVTQRLAKQIHKQLGRWKSRRFQTPDESPRREHESCA